MNAVMLRHIYGRSSFGSGGAWGGVLCANARAVGHGSNGFVSGVAAVGVIDPTRPARVSARGGDCIGEREWGEDYEFVPKRGWVEVTAFAPDPAPAGREERAAWCGRATDGSGAALVARAAEKAKWAAARAAEKAAAAAAAEAVAAAAAAAKARAIAARARRRSNGRAGSPGRCL